MSKYRKLNNGVEYTIGKSFCVIRQKDKNIRMVVNKSDIGFDRGFDERGRPRFLITPGMVRDYFHNGKIGPAEKYFPSCSCKATKKLTCNPFKREIHDKIVYEVLCDHCIHESCMSI